MLQRTFRRKSNRTNMNTPDFEGHKSEFSLEKSESNVPDYSFRVPNRIFVGGLSSNTDEWDIRSKFSKHGHVKFVKIIRDSIGSSKGYGFVTFATEEEAKNVIEKVQVIIKGRKLNIGPAVKRQTNSSNSCSTEKTCASTTLEQPCVLSSQIPKCQPKSSYLKYKDNWPGLNNWSLPYFMETSSFFSGTQLSPMDHLGENAQVNSLQPYPTFVYVPPYPYEQTAGFSYAPYRSFSDLMPVVAVPMLDHCMYRDMQLR